MPVKFQHPGMWLNPSGDWKNIAATTEMKNKGLLTDDNFYVTVKNVN
jgi:hypothetical protein